MFIIQQKENKAYHIYWTPPKANNSLDPVA